MYSPAMYQGKERMDLKSLNCRALVKKALFDLRDTHLSHGWSCFTSHVQESSIGRPDKATGRVLATGRLAKLLLCFSLCIFECDILDMSIFRKIVGIIAAPKAECSYCLSTIQPMLLQCYWQSNKRSRMALKTLR